MKITKSAFLAGVLVSATSAWGIVAIQTPTPAISSPQAAPAVEPGLSVTPSSPAQPTPSDQVKPGPSASAGQVPDGAKWLLGTWYFDPEYTAQKFGQNPPDDASALAGGLAIAQLTEALKGARVRVSDHEILITSQDGNGKADRYEVLEMPDADTVSLKKPDGEVTAYHREGDRFWTASTGTVHARFYFRRNENPPGPGTPIPQ